MISKLERSQSFEIWKAARYANWTGLPVAVLFLTQELSAHLRDENPDLAVEIAEGTKEICEHVIENAEEMSKWSGSASNEEQCFFDKCQNKGKKNRHDSDTKLIRTIKILLDLYPESAMTAKRKHSRERFAPADHS